MSNDTNKKYWEERVKAEKAYQQEQLKDVNAFNNEIAGLYQVAMDDIIKDIAYFESKIDKYGGESAKQVLLTRLNTLYKKEKDWAKLVKMKKKDFTDQKKNRYYLLKYTMELGRANFLKAEIGERLDELGFQQEKKLTDKLASEYKKEQLRQAGILGITIKQDLWQSKPVMQKVYTQVHSADYSDRVWANIDQLKAKLDGVIASELIRGENPRSISSRLTDQVKDSFKNANYASERIARTETARVQTESAKDVFKEHGAKYVLWIAEPVACSDCKKIAEASPTSYGKGIYELENVPDLPVHPNCRCSIGAYHPRLD